MIPEREVPCTLMNWYKVQPVGLKFDFANVEQKAQVKKFISTLYKNNKEQGH